MNINKMVLKLSRDEKVKIILKIDNLKDLKNIRFVNNEYKLYTKNSKCQVFHEREKSVLVKRLREIAVTTMASINYKNLDPQEKNIILNVLSFAIAIRGCYYYNKKLEM